MAKIEVLVGMIASGKSTYARERAKAGALVIAHDDLAAMLHAEYRYEPELREVYRRMEESIAFAALSAGRDVVIDRTHLTRESRRRWLTWAAGYDDLNTFDGKGPTTRVEVVAFNVLKPHGHARRRFEADPRGRSLEEWTKVAEHHYGQAKAEPFDCRDEGFRRASYRRTLLDPVVIDPPMDVAAAWQECRDYVDRRGGLTHPDGEPNWRAAFGADPGIVSCPGCTQQYWAFGRRHRCVQCGFEYPTDWRSMYAYGNGAATAKQRYKHEERLAHPYYRYGFEHPVADAWAEHDKIDWPSVLSVPESPHPC